MEFDGPEPIRTASPQPPDPTPTLPTESETAMPAAAESEMQSPTLVDSTPETAADALNASEREATVVSGQPQRLAPIGLTAYTTNLPHRVDETAAGVGGLPPEPSKEDPGAGENADPGSSAGPEPSTPSEVVVKSEPQWVPLPPPPSTESRVLAGIESGVMGAALFLVWLAFEAWRGRLVWWSYHNLLGSVIYGPFAFRAGLGRVTLAGIALETVVCGAVGALFGWLLAKRGSTTGRVVRGLAAGVLLYFCVYHVFGRVWFPMLVAHAPQPVTLLSHLLIGVVLSRTVGRADELEHR